MVASAFVVHTGGRVPPGASSIIWPLIPGPVTPPRPARAVNLRKGKFEAVTSQRLAPYGNEAPFAHCCCAPRMYLNTRVLPVIFVSVTAGNKLFGVSTAR
eukprot:scaffold131760_cov36-Tisochrysis_lutea.AAC.1